MAPQLQPLLAGLACGYGVYFHGSKSFKYATEDLVVDIVKAQRSIPGASNFPKAVVRAVL